MINFSAHLGYQFNEVPFKERFSLARNCGYSYVEFPNPYILNKEELGALLSEHELRLVQFGTPQGATDEKGFAALPGRSEEFNKSIEKSIDYSLHLKCKLVHPMSGCDSIHNKTSWKAYVDNSRICSEIYAENDLCVLLEVMSLPTVKGYFLNSYELFSALREEIPNENISLLFDTWHAKIIYDDVMHPLIKYFPFIKHIQISDFPGRHEPGTGTINFPHLFQFLNEKNYLGYVGCEYKPSSSTRDGLNFMSKFQKENL